MSLSNRKIGFIGAGNMAFALMKGLVNSGLVPPENIMASDPEPSRFEDLSKSLNITITTDNIAVAKKSDIIMICVKPQVAKYVMDEISQFLKEKLLISIAAGVKTEFFEHYLSGLRVIRVMSNTPALVGEGSSAICAGKYAGKPELEIADKLFCSVGKVAVIEEKYMDAVTGLSGSGPAYVFKFIEALSDAGVKLGLSRETSRMLAAQTVYGSAKLVLETGEHPMALKDMVTSPGGTTIVGVHMLEKGGFSAAVIDAVEEATKRSEELGKK
ncbi:pyrroline-5-carboxylate reductase [Geovibrio ferrireducens]|uniref:pyrroline-5-carboxylate reductase n=1 Tax=Geovibrio ferrireducens TaxID=46201 RepID=UPI00224865FC|nr:pyrroline-5-carboxylate reductase [Geovibrio ferrireducens]